MPASSPDSTLPNGQDGAIPPGVAGYARKTKAKKPVDMNASKLLKHRIAQLEQDAAGEKDQEAEIEREVKKASREMMLQQDEGQQQVQERQQNLPGQPQAQ
ncbi:hypothetical protein HYQ44_003989 [Verticillium longisporum]|nr:hypothetical protein HYQ44_003989 [Verticillium longisporum]